MNTKRIYFLLTLATTVSATSLTHAHVGNTSSNLNTKGQNAFTGFHMTGAAGLGRLESKVKRQLATPGGLRNGGRYSATANGLSLSGWGDYIVDYQGFLVGVEAGVSFQKKETKHESLVNVGLVSLPLKENLKHSYSLRAGVVLGKPINETTAIYVGLGATRGSFEYIAQNGNNSGKKKFDLWGVSPSVGLKVQLSDQMLLDLRYQHTFYKTKNIKNLPVNGSSVNGKVRPESSMASIGLTYKF